MPKNVKCQQCGAKNALDARRCRVCANLINAEVPEEPYQPKALPEHIQRRLDGVVPEATQTFIPGETAAAGSDASTGPSAGGGFGSLPPPPNPAGDGWGPAAPPPPPPDPYGGYSPPPPPPPVGAPGPDPFAAYPPPPVPAGDDIVIDAPPRHAAPIEVEPPPLPPEEKFDPDALFRDMGRSHLPPPPPPPRPPDELQMPTYVKPPDPLQSLTVDANATSEDIERAAAEAIRNERLRRRPSILDKVFKPEDEDDHGTPTAF